MSYSDSSQVWQVRWTAVNDYLSISDQSDLHCGMECTSQCHDLNEPCQTSPYRQEILKIAGSIVKHRPRLKRKPTVVLDTGRKRHCSETFKGLDQPTIKDETDDTSVQKLEAKALKPVQPRASPQILLKVTKPHHSTTLPKHNKKISITRFSEQEEDTASTTDTIGLGSKVESSGNDLREPKSKNTPQLPTDEQGVLTGENFGTDLSYDLGKKIETCKAQHKAVCILRNASIQQEDLLPDCPLIRTETQSNTFDHPSRLIQSNGQPETKTPQEAAVCLSNTVLPQTPVSLLRHPTTKIQNTSSQPPIRPFMRRFPTPTFPSPSSPFTSFQASNRILTCFRTAEVLRIASQAATSKPPIRCPTIELFARVIDSERNDDVQKFKFADIFFPQRPPYLRGEFKAWKKSPIYDADSKAFLTKSNTERTNDGETGKLCRAIIDVTPSNSLAGKPINHQERWVCQISTIWESEWEEIQVTKDIVEPDMVECKKTVDGGLSVQEVSV